MRHNSGTTFDSADQIGAALQGNIVVSLNVLPNCIYLLIPSPPSLSSPAQVTVRRESRPCRRRMELEADQEP